MAEIRKKGAALERRGPGADGGARGPARRAHPFTVRWNRESKSATVEIEGTTVHLAEGGWSTWVPLEFRVNFLVRLYGMAQFYLVRADDELQLYMSPINWRPESPVMPISSPASLSAELYESLGTYRTLGWAEATWPLNEDRIDEKAFMDDLFRAFDDRARIILHEIDSKKFDLVIGVIESTDRVQHMFWRFIDPTHPMYDPAAAAKYGDSIERVYRRCDQLVGEVLQRVDPGHAGLRPVRPRLPLVQVRREPQHVARRQRLHRPPGAAARRQEPQRHVRRRRPVLGGRGLDAHAGLLAGPRPDLLQPEGPRGPGDRQPGRGLPAARRRTLRQAADDDRPEDRRSASSATSTSGTMCTRARTWPTRPDLQVGFDGRLPRVVADLARRHRRPGCSTRT